MYQHTAYSIIFNSGNSPLLYSSVLHVHAKKYLVKLKFFEVKKITLFSFFSRQKHYVVKKCLGYAQA